MHLEQIVTPGNLKTDTYVMFDSDEYLDSPQVTIAERVELRRQKKSDDEQPDTTDMPDLESEESA